MATLYKLYINKDRKSALVLEEGKSPDLSIWDSIGEVEGEASFDIESASNATLFHYVKDLLYKAFLDVGELSGDSGRHLYVMGLPKGFTIHTIDPSKQLTFGTGIGSQTISASGATIENFAKFSELGEGTLSFTGSGLPVVFTLENTDEVKAVISEVVFEPEEYRNRVTTATVTATDEDGRVASYSARIVILHPSTPEYAGDGEVSGTAEVGETLTAAVGTWSNANSTDITTTVQWLRDGKVIAGAEGATYTLTAEDEGAMIAARIKATAVAGTSHYRETFGHTPEVGPVVA